MDHNFTANHIYGKKLGESHVESTYWKSSFSLKITASSDFVQMNSEAYFNINFSLYYSECSSESRVGTLGPCPK